MKRQRVTYGLRGWRSKAVAVIALLAPVPALAQTDILALGDSLTQGYGLVEAEGFVPQLDAWLSARGHDVRIVNGGVSGDTTAGGLARIDWSLTPEIDAVIVALGGNDLLRGIAPEVARQNMRGILEVTQDRDLAVLLIGMQAPGNYGRDYKQAFDAIYPELAEEFDALHHPSFFSGLMDGDAAPADLSGFMQPDGIHPNADGVARIVAGIGPDVERLIALSSE